MSPAKEFLSLEEVAELLGVNYQLIYNLARSGKLPAARVGRIYRVLRSDLDAYLESTKSSATTPAGVCASCGKTYYSRTSLAHECAECQAPICVDCFERRRVRRCAAHGEPESNAKKDRKSR